MREAQKLHSQGLSGVRAGEGTPANRGQLPLERSRREAWGGRMGELAKPKPEE